MNWGSILQGATQGFQNSFNGTNNRPAGSPMSGPIAGIIPKILKRKKGYQTAPPTPQDTGVPSPYSPTYEGTDENEDLYG